MNARSRIDGVLLLDKPAEMSSNHALQAAKRILNARKAGHTGTLDPMATGLLPLTFSEATKFSQMLLDADKRYRAKVRLGVTTTTLDAEGEVLERREVCVGRDELERALDAFRGEIEQIPPMHSALKRDGRPLYELARRGEEVEREARAVTIRELSLLDWSDATIELDVLCSKGTYVRTLAADLGRLLGCGGHLSALRRTGIGPFEVGDAVGLDALEAAQDPQRHLLPVDALVRDFLSVQLDGQQALRFRCGQAVPGEAGPPGLRRVWADGAFLGLGRLDEQGLLLPHRLVSSV